MCTAGLNYKLQISLSWHCRPQPRAPDLSGHWLQTASSISVGTAGPQPPRRSPTASSRCEWHRELQISAAGSQWALPDRELQMSVGLAGPHCRTASATAHWAVALAVEVGSAHVRECHQKECGTRCQIQCQKECQSICGKECQIECQNKNYIYIYNIYIYMP